MNHYLKWTQEDYWKYIGQQYRLCILPSWKNNCEDGAGKQLFLYSQC